LHTSNQMSKLSFARFSLIYCNPSATYQRHEALTRMCFQFGNYAVHVSRHAADAADAFQPSRWQKWLQKGLQKDRFLKLSWQG
jgi:hypothetical protein